MAKFKPVKTILPNGTERVVMVEVGKNPKKPKKLTSNQESNE
jgi:hypothetical protein